MHTAGKYTQEVWWWDHEDNEYMLETVWYYYPLDRETNQGDYAELCSIEVLDQAVGAPNIDHLLDKGGDVWKSVEDDFNINRAELLDDDYEPVSADMEWF